MSHPDTNRASSSLLRPREPLVGRLQRYWRDGGPWGWLNAMAVSVSLVLVLGLLSLLVVGYHRTNEGKGSPWPLLMFSTLNTKPKDQLKFSWPLGRHRSSL